MNVKGVFSERMCVCSGLPVDLQYLPEDKKREDDPDIRKMLLETLLLVRRIHRTHTHTHAGVIHAELSVSCS